MPLAQDVRMAEPRRFGADYRGKLSVRAPAANGNWRNT